MELQRRFFFTIFLEASTRQEYSFTFPVWLTGLIFAVAVLAALSPLAFCGSRGLRYLAYPYAVIMFVNGVQHIVGSFYMGAPMPGVLSAPVLLIASAVLFVSVLRRAAGLNQ